ncbi:efflux RND transporter periplasmic adaptor subunit [Flavobacterium sp. FlaQc-48]|uniref:efflux RND transporter periplasmic adaptor subunit n=1 Tax=Flavobacterium sp. FlaQc-48 TaxID=3374181 RepID=UPI003756ED48
MKKKIILILILLTAVFIVYKLLSNKKQINLRNRPSESENLHIPVTIAPVKEELLENKLKKTGMLAPFQEAKVLSANSGIVKRLLFNPGDKVSKGQILGIIDTRLLQIDLQKSQSNVSKLKGDLKTYTELLQGNAATQEKVNEIRQNYNDAASRSEQLRQQIADATIKAPTNGIIGLKSVEEGMFVSTGAEIASIVNLSSVKVAVYLTESEVYKISTGQQIKLTTDIYPDKSFFGKVTFISPQANETYNYKVEITGVNDPHSPLRSGTFVTADFSVKTKQKILTLPRQALLASMQDASVYVSQNGKAILRSIKTGEEYGSTVQVITGLAKGDQVITSGQINLQNGTLIKISK